MNAPASKSGEGVVEAGLAFRRFFGELEDTFLEREWLFTQLQLALLCREHVLIIGPPGTAKSAIASAVLGRIVDAGTGRPSLFSKQLAENTVQTDLIGPVDFKVLTETGRTEHLTDEGMLGAVHAFLDEVFDGRDMLLRSILNVLQERELKHGRKVTPGQCECAVMTSNRYLSEVLQRSPETLQAFADRISFICFTPKSFARPASRARMLLGAQRSERPVLSQRLTLQQLDLLQEQVTRVEVPPLVAEGLERLSDALERELLAQVTRLPDYVPTKYFSQRSTVKALWTLKAAVVRDRLYHRPERALEAELGDLEALRYFFLLGGPPPEELDALVRAAADPRERAQLEIIRLEARAFEEALKTVAPGLAQASEREAAELQAPVDLASAEAQARAWTPAVASVLARALAGKLAPGPRHPANRPPLVRAAEVLAAALRARVVRGAAPQAEARGGVALAASFLEVLHLVERVPELAPRGPEVSAALVEYAAQALQALALAAEGAEFDEGLKLEGVVGLASSLTEELRRVVALLDAAAPLAGPAAEAARRVLPGARARTGAALRRRAARVFEQSQAGRQALEPLEQLTLDARRLAELERVLEALSPAHAGLLQELLTPLGGRYALAAVNAGSFTRLEPLVRALQAVVGNLAREGASVPVALAVARPAVEGRIRAWLAALPRPRAQVPEPAQALSGEAATLYRQGPAASALDGELEALGTLDRLLAEAGVPPLPPDVREAVAAAELASLGGRVTFLRTWLAHLLAALPRPEGSTSKVAADRAFDVLVKSRLPLLVTREAELVRLQTALGRLAREPGERGEAAVRLAATVRTLAEDFMDHARRLLDARAGV